MSILDTVASTFAKLAGKGLAASCVLSRAYVGAYDPATGTNAVGAATTCAVPAVFDASGGLGYVFGADLVQAGDIKASIPAKGLTLAPAPGDSLIALGSTFAVVGVKPTFAGAVPVSYDLLVRR
jgi:hypothetical protein